MHGIAIACRGFGGGRRGRTGRAAGGGRAIRAVRGRWLAAVLAIGMGASFISSGPATATGPKAKPTYQQQYVQGQLMVRFASGMSDAAIDAVNARLGAATIRSYHVVPGLR